VASALKNMQYQISVEEKIRIKAKKALDKMLDLSN
jgi:quinolinate synthase